MRVAITGSSGLIGTALRTSLEGDGHEVLRIVRGAGGAGRVPWDIERGQLDPSALDGIDAAVHLAGAGIADKRWTDDHKRAIRESRTKGTALLSTALAALDRPPAVLVSGSGIDFYGDRGDEVLTEASESGPPGFLTAVVEAWEAATAPAEAAGIRVAHIRTSMVLAAKGGALAKMASFAKLGLLGKMGSGRQWMSWITLDDEVRAIRFVLEGDLSGPVNLASPNPVTNEAFTKALGRALHRPTFLPVPTFGPKLLLGKELADTLLFESKRVVPEKLERAGFQFKQADLDEALKSVLT